LLDFYLARAERHNPALNAIVVCSSTRRENAPRRSMAALARGRALGDRCTGIPMTVKESFDVAGLPTTFAIRSGRTTSPRTTPS